MAIPIVFNSVNVNGQYTNATVSIGENTQTGWNAPSKNNFAFGPTFGQNFVVTPFDFINDSDLSDAPMFTPDLTSSFQNQTV